MSPLIFLSFVLLLLAWAVVHEQVWRVKRLKSLRNLGRQWGMHVAPADRLRLAERILPRLPIPAAANVRVLDLLYHTDHDHHLYLFTLEYTAGAVLGKECRRQVAGFSEPLARRGLHLPIDAALTLAPIDLPWQEAYAHVRNALANPPVNR